MSFLDRIREINRHAPDDFVDFDVDSRQIGAIRRDRIDTLLDHGDAFMRKEDGALTFAGHLASPDGRSDAIAGLAESLVASGTLSRLRGELYPAKRRFTDRAAFVADRAIVPFLGLRAWGVHVNGYTCRDGKTHLWIGKRAKDKATYPGMWDNMVAGGQPADLGLMDNVMKECAEEADISGALARQARPVGAVTYTQQTVEGLKPDVLFCYDLEVPEDFTPRNTDGEIESFHLWPVRKVARTVAETRDFKDNCNLVIIDFLIRHGRIVPDDPDYVDLLQGLHA